MSSTDPIDQIRVILAEHGVDLDTLVIGIADGDSCLYYDEEDYVLADHIPLSEALAEVIKEFDRG